jgi:hypothetical protein
MFDQAGELDRLEAVIESGIGGALAVLSRGSNFVEVGRALREIRDRRLYKATHRRFQDYCKARWGLDRRRAYQFMEAAILVDECGVKGLPIPNCERQARTILGERRARQEAAELLGVSVEGGQKDEQASPAPESASGTNRRGQAAAANAETERRIDALVTARDREKKIESTLARLKKLHAGHPRAERAEHFLGMYRSTILPWPSG